VERRGEERREGKRRGEERRGEKRRGRKEAMCMDTIITNAEKRLLKKLLRFTDVSEACAASIFRN
jgi:hypothetical protein